MEKKGTKLKGFEVVYGPQREENSLCSDLSKGPNKDKIGWPIAHYIGIETFEGENQKIQSAIGLAGYFPVAHKNFNEFYGSLKGGESDYLKFKSLEERTRREFDACDYSTSKDAIICPLDSYYKSSKNYELFDLNKIENEEIILDSIELAKNLNKKGLKNKVDLIVYDKALYDVGDLKFREDDGSLDEIEENREYLNKLKEIEGKYGLTFLEKIDLPYPFLLYEHLRSLNTDLFYKL